MKRLILKLYLWSAISEYRKFLRFDLDLLSSDFSRLVFFYCYFKRNLWTRYRNITWEFKNPFEIIFVFCFLPTFFKFTSVYFKSTFIWYRRKAKGLLAWYQMGLILISFYKLHTGVFFGTEKVNRIVWALSYVGCVT